MSAGALQDRPLAGIGYMLAAFVTVAVGDALAKILITEMPIAQFLLLRSVAVVLLLIPYFMRRGGWVVFRTERLSLHLWRCALNGVSLVLFFVALRQLELATLFAISFVGPLFMTAISVPMLGEKVGRHRWAAILVGFIGALVIIRPGADGLQVLALMAVASTCLWSLSMVIVRMLSATDSDATLLAYINISLLLMGAVSAPFVWQPVSLTEFGYVIALAVTLVIGQWLMLRAFRLAPVGVVAPFQYSGIIWATIIGWWVWAEFPTLNVWIGAAILIASGLYVMWRERIRAREARAEP
ncbi:MAG: DMT family transporter [Alphaproteobacteria bacterium]|nr:DMT family transporter [Alphaproteobacteria bacterium]